MSYSIFEDIDISNYSIKNTTFKGSVFIRLQSRSNFFKKVDFCESYFDNVIFEQTEIESCNWGSTEIHNTHWLRSRIYDSSFHIANISYCRFHELTIERTPFLGSKLYFVRFYLSNLIGSQKFRPSSVFHSTCFTDARLCDVSFTNSTFEKTVDFSNTILENETQEDILQKSKTLTHPDRVIEYEAQQKENIQSQS